MKYKTISFLAAVILLSIIDTRGSVALHALKGKRAELNFSYLCDSAYVTLRQGHTSPFYVSNNPELTEMPPTYLVTKHNATADSGDYCNLQLTINPVMIDDGGGYILSAYKNDKLHDDNRVWLSVEYPPGKASCESAIYIDDQWVSLHCTAPVGTIQGKIICYQGGIRIPPLSLPEENDETLNHIILARQSSDQVHCCSSTLQQKENRCECKDWGWDPIDNTLLDILNPCPNISSSKTTTDLPFKSDESELRRLSAMIITLVSLTTTVCVIQCIKICLGRKK